MEDRRPSPDVHAASSFRRRLACLTIAAAGTTLAFTLSGWMHERENGVIANAFTR